MDFQKELWVQDSNGEKVSRIVDQVIAKIETLTLPKIEPGKKRKG